MAKNEPTLEERVASLERQVEALHAALHLMHAGMKPGLEWLEHKYTQERGSSRG